MPGICIGKLYGAGKGAGPGCLGSAGAVVETRQGGGTAAAVDPALEPPGEAACAPVDAAARREKRRQRDRQRKHANRTAARAAMAARAAAATEGP